MHHIFIEAHLLLIDPIGLLFTIVISGLNQFFSFRFPSVFIGNVGLIYPFRELAINKRHLARSAAIVVPRRKTLGASHTELLDIWPTVEPWTIHCQRTCIDDYYRNGG